MAKPVYKIETWTGGVKDHTIGEDGSYDALRVYTKDIITDGVGHFSFMVPTKKNGSSYYYNDIALGDTVKIWFGYDGVAGNPDFIGKVGRISGPLSTQQGYLREISGLSQGEILLRRLKRWKTFDQVTAYNVVKELAEDLGIFDAGDMDADANLLTLHIENESYIDVLKRVSDYWVDAAHQVKKDFWVGIDNDLHWQDRPVRTAGVETLTVGSNIVSYVVTRDVQSVINKIYVYGIGQKKQPEWQDDWTETLTNWTVYPGGSLSLDTGDKEEGQASIKFMDTEAAGNTAEAGGDRAIETVDWSEDNGVARTLNLKYKYMCSVVPTGAYTFETYLFCPNIGNSAWAAEANPVEDTWHTLSYSKGDFVTFAGTPDYENITKIRHIGKATSVANPMTLTVKVDDIYFSEGRTNALIQDAASQASYGIRELQHIDPQLVTSAECTSRGQTLLYQLKDPPSQIIVTTPGNTNILIGDRLPMTIPAENISAANYDVISVERSFSSQGFLTTATTVNTGDIRRAIEVTPQALLINMQRKIRRLSKGISVV